MRFLILTLAIFVLVLHSNSLQAETLSSRLKDAASSTESAELILNKLQSKQLDNLSAEDYLVMAEGYQTLNNREAALDAVNKAEAIATSPYLRALSLFSKAQIHGILYQDAEMALQQLIQAEQILLQLTDAESKILLNDVLSSFASAYNLQGNLKSALHYAERSLVLARKLDNPSRELNALILSGRIALQNNQYQQAFNYLKLGLVLATQLKDEEQLASIHFRLGMAHRKLDQHTDALEHFTQAAERYLQLNRMPNYSYVLVYMAESYLEDPDQIDKAEELLQQALEIAEKHQNMTRAATVYYSLGRAALLRKQYAESEAYYHQALQHFRQINSRSLVLETSLALVQLLIEQQRYSDAVAMLNEVAPEIDTAATFLQLRYTTSAARLAAAASDWQRAYQLQEKVTELNHLELANQIQHNMTELKEGLKQARASEQQDNLTTDLKQALAAAESRQLMLQLLLVLMIFVAFFIWQLYRRQQTQPLLAPAPEITPRQWSQFREKLKTVSQQQPLTLLVLLPRFRAALQRQHGRRIVAELLMQVEQELATPEIKASFRGTEMLWLAIACEDTEAQQQLTQQAVALLQQKLVALDAEPAVLAVELIVSDLLGANWHKDDINALTEAIWFGWSMAESQPVKDPAWLLTFTTEHPRPCEWQVEDLRADMLNACRLGELKLQLNKQPLTISG